MRPDAPREDGAETASDDAKLDGLVEQMRDDVRVGNVHDIAAVLQTRLDDAGLVVDEARFAELLRSIQGV
jgi:hypothetical protein